MIEVARRFDYEWKQFNIVTDDEAQCRVLKTALQKARMPENVYTVDSVKGV